MGRAFDPTIKAAHRNRRLRRELRDGESHSSSHVRIVDTGVTSGGDPEVKVTVKTGPETEATFRTTVSGVSIPRVGDTMYVLYDPTDPTVAIRH